MMINVFIALGSVAIASILGAWLGYRAGWQDAGGEPLGNDAADGTMLHPEMWPHNESE